MKKNSELNLEEFLQAFDELEKLYPRVLPLTMWRAWEMAAYRRFQLLEPVLDLGCGNGQFFRQVWPKVEAVVGIDINSDAVLRAQQSGVYNRVHLSPAHQIPEADASFNTVFSNCAMEHMDQIDFVVKDVWRILRPGGFFLFSVVTDNFLAWAPLPKFLATMGAAEQSKALEDEYVHYHNLVNPFSVEKWSELLSKNGFQIKAHVPIAPDTFARVFLLMDQLWHVPYHTSEIGEPMLGYLQTLPNFFEGVKDIVTGLWKLSAHNEHGAGAIFYAQKGIIL